MLLAALLMSLEPSNCLYMLEFAYTNCFSDLFSRAAELTLANFTEAASVHEGAALTKLPADVLCYVLQHDDLQVRDPLALSSHTSFPPPTVPCPQNFLQPIPLLLV
jgi:hypothetical protein